MIEVAAQVLHFLALVAEFVWLGGNPADVVLLESLDEVDAFEHVRDIVDPSLLHAEHFHCFVEVEAVVFGVDEAFDEFLGELDKPILFPPALAAVLVEQALVLELHLPTGHFISRHHVTCLVACLRVAALVAQTRASASALCHPLRLVILFLPFTCSNTAILALIH